ncbi:MAG: hypothetical protein ACK2UA_06450 [Anaerolineae bacterium]
MRHTALTGHRLVAAFLVGLLLFCSPVTALFDQPLYWKGIPLLYLYFFAAWAMYIALLAWILRGKGE